MSQKTDIRPISNTTVIIIMGTFVPRPLRFVYTPLADIFRERGYRVRTLGIPCLGLGSLDGAADALEQRVFTDDPDEKFIFVGHSQGGVHTLDLASRHPEKVLAVFNFAAPHHGTRLANLGSWVAWVPAIRGMAAHSQHLHELRGVKAFEEENIHSLFTVFDQLVVPWFASGMLGAQNVVLVPKTLQRLLKGAGLTRSNGTELIHGYADHLFIIWHKQFHAYIERTLDQLEATARIAT
ncbi:alpha/beta fold hydrolase [Candidatus Saccharibacteria bacterium]|nr:alpha/beta fold hydrolase [Candidatus Saccharibacteria bacterium]